MTEKAFRKLGDLLDQRYGGQARPEIPVSNEMFELLLAQRSVRAYLDKPLPEGALEMLVAAAQSAPSSSNLHQWSVIAVSDPELKAKLACLSRINSMGLGQPYIDEAPLLLLWVADLSRIHGVGVEEGLDFESIEFLDSFLTAAVDASLAAESAMIAARAIGLSTVCIGAMRNQAAEVARLVNLPPRAFAVFGLVVGYEDPARPSSIRPRPSQEVVLHHNVYDPERAARVLQDYEKAMMDFQTRQGMTPRGWRGSVIRASVGISYLDGREHLQQTLKQREFGLK